MLSVVCLLEVFAGCIAAMVLALLGELRCVDSVASPCTGFRHGVLLSVVLFCLVLLSSSSFFCHAVARAMVVLLQEEWQQLLTHRRSSIRQEQPSSFPMGTQEQVPPLEQLQHLGALFRFMGFWELLGAGAVGADGAQNSSSMSIMTWQGILVQVRHTEMVL